MIIASIVVLFILQLLTIFFVLLLQAKVSRFNQLEEKQNRLMRDMDDVIGAYLVQMQEENQRFIEELAKTKAAPQATQPVVHKQPVTSTVDIVESTEVVLPKVQEKVRMVVPKTKAAKAYQQQEFKAPPVPKMKKELTLEQQAVELASQGLTIEEIAKQLQKGKTEIALLLKFRA